MKDIGSVSKQRVFVAKIAACTSAGTDIEQTFNAVVSGNTGIRKNKDYSNDDVAIGLLDSSLSFWEHLKSCFLSLKIDKEAKKTFLVCGSSVGGMLQTEQVLCGGKGVESIDVRAHAVSSIKEKLQELFSFDGAISFSTACTSSANALAFGFELIKSGAYDRVVVVGADSISKTTVQGFEALGVLSKSPCKPFDKDRDGMNVAEGIACLVLENEPSEQSVEILGYGASSDAYSITHPCEDGAGAKEAMLQALQNSKLNASDIDYINAHGTATLANDDAEAKAISDIFDTNTLVSSTKSITGHTLGAAGAIEAALVCEMIRHGVVIKNNFLVTPNSTTVNFALCNEQKRIYYALSNSFAFGGNNICIAFGAVK